MKSPVVFNRDTVTSVKWQVLFDTPLLFDERGWRLDDEKGCERGTSLVTETTGKIIGMRSCSKHEKRGVKPIRVRLVDTTKEGRVRSRRVLEVRLSRTVFFFKTPMCLFLFVELL